MYIVQRFIFVLGLTVYVFNPRTTEFQERLNLLQKRIEETAFKVRCSAARTRFDVKRRVPELCKFS